MTKQKTLYLLMHKGIPIKIDDSEKVRAICEYGYAHKFSGRPVAHWEAHLLQPDIRDYLETVA